MQSFLGLNRRNNLSKLVLGVAIPLAVGILGSLFTRRSGQYYQSLQLPSYAPPSSVFAPVWTVLYLMMGVASYRVWRVGFEKTEVRLALYLFWLQLIVNFFWTVLFFGLNLPGAALVDILVLVLLIALTTDRFFKIDPTAGYLMVPYLLWVCFAAVLNYSIWRLNG